MISWKRFLARREYLRSLLPFIPIFGVLFTLDYFSSVKILGVVGATSLSSSACSVAVIPNAEMNEPRHLLGAYLIGCIVGVSGYFFSFYFAHHFPYFVTKEYPALVGSIAVCVCLFLMLLVRFIHFPAAGFCLALVIEAWDTRTILIVASFLILLALMRYFFWDRLKDLI
jgi:HPP family